MKFIISSKYFSKKITKAVIRDVDSLQFKNNCLYLINTITKKKIFISIEKIGKITNIDIIVNELSLCFLLKFLKRLEEQPIIVEITDMGPNYSAQFVITNTIAKF